MGHSDDLIGGKILFRFSRKCAPEIHVKFGVNKRIFFDGKEQYLNCKILLGGDAFAALTKRIWHAKVL